MSVIFLSSFFGALESWFLNRIIVVSSWQNWHTLYLLLELLPPSPFFLLFFPLGLMVMDEGIKVSTSIDAIILLVDLVFCLCLSLLFTFFQQTLIFFLVLFNLFFVKSLPVLLFLEDPFSLLLQPILYFLEFEFHLFVFWCLDIFAPQLALLHELFPLLSPPLQYLQSLLQLFLFL